ncbi:MAG: helix-hairpin-helix domain-containing protein [Chthonomonas sp.]|nr:helix-hairpin-helix domain-containing protein [Chthonomonas sp.]
MSDLSSRQKAGISTLLVSLTAVAGLAGISLSKGGGTSTRFSPGDMVVQIGGSVRNPGTYKLAPGARMEDAVAQAGGLRKDADQDGVNLAKRVRDGERIYVPSLGEETPPAMTYVPDGAATPSYSPPRNSGPTGPISINTANQADLESLPGIGPAMATRILQYRVQIGGFRTIEQLNDVKGIGDKTLAKLRPYLKL